MHLCNIPRCRGVVVFYPGEYPKTCHSVHRFAVDSAFSLIVKARLSQRLLFFLTCSHFPECYAISKTDTAKLDEIKLASF